ncbi:hypothetical protein CDL15_Pgr016240 [Punica granatum]|uniref:Serine aminopeptidase S33 domain-containing protein n=1 Tax=Punica granatum TaxID=22663 RepID=A0A218X1A2_PUNGR|nr:hypothetical protein CDL15_Pgr016240 [Punica granatum]
MEQLVNFIIRPPRAEYNPKYDLLDQEFMLKGRLYQRKDVEIPLSSNAFMGNFCPPLCRLKTVEEMSSSAVITCPLGCRVDASETAIVLLPSNITVFAVDFSGSGLSEGEYVSLGWFEKDDLKAAVEYLRADGNVSLIGLWGRSMGAVTSLMYGAEDPSIAGMVLDSPFSDLMELMMELADTQSFRLPKFTVKLAIQYMRRAIQKKAKFDIAELNTIKVAKSCFVPALFGHATDDDFIRPHHSDRIFEAYMGDKNIIKFEGDHNSPRPQFYFDSINIFFHNVLQPPDDEGAGPIGGNPQDDYFATSSMRNIPGQPSSRQSSSGTEDKEVEGENPHASSSGMIEFEPSGGQSYDPHDTTSACNDQYLEYQLDDLTGFPCSAEEEEKMIMAAVLESLKDMEMRHPSDNEPIPDTIGNCSESSQKEDIDTSSTSEHAEDSIVEPASTLIGTSHNLTTETNNPSPDTSSSSNGPSSGPPPPPVLEAGSKEASDVSGDTKASSTEEKDPVGNGVDGLIRRWDFNLFKNSR